MSLSLLQLATWGRAGWTCTVSRPLLLAEELEEPKFVCRCDRFAPCNRLASRFFLRDLFMRRFRESCDPWRSTDDDAFARAPSAGRDGGGAERERKLEPWPAAVAVAASASRTGVGRASAAAFLARKGDSGGRVVCRRVAPTGLLLALVAAPSWLATRRCFPSCVI